MTSHSNKAQTWQLGIAACVAVAATGYLVSFIQKKRPEKTPLTTSIPSPPPATKISQTTVLVVGGGTIGAGFASIFLAQGMKVIVKDPRVSRETLEKRIREYWPFMVTRGLTTANTKEPPFESFQKIDDLRTATRNVDFVQECVFEDVETKQSILAQLDALVDPSILIASSTSFIPWSLLYNQCQHKHRLMIGHPIIPHYHSFMEIYGLYPEWTACCKDWYTQAGFDTIVMKETIPGHVFNSFLRVTLDHAHSLTRQGICSPEDINTAFRHLGRCLYGQHFYLSLLTVIGGDRGFAGGLELGARIQNDAIFLTLFSSMKRYGYPDFIARPVSKYFGRTLSKLLPTIPEEYLDSARALDDKITRGGTVEPLVGLHGAFSEMEKRIPLAAGNDPLSIESLSS